jgi:hypothetical protein
MLAEPSVSMCNGARCPIPLNRRHSNGRLGEATLPISGVFSLLEEAYLQ